MAEQPALVLRGFGVAFAGTPVIADVDLELPRAGLVVLVGPAGSGKSTLLRTLAGINDSHPSLSMWGVAELCGRPLFGDEAHRPARGIGLVTQQSRFFTSTVRENLASAMPNRSRLDRLAQGEIARRLLCESGLTDIAEQLDAEVIGLPQSAQRMLAIVRATADDPAVLLADEPTSGLDDEAAIDVIALLRAQARTRAVLFVTHNQRHALAAGGATVLLAGGRVVEGGPTTAFFREPKTDPGKRFVATGGCALPSPGAIDDELDEAAPRPPPLPAAARQAALRGAVGPRGFFWVLPHVLGGLPRPGIVAELDEDLDGLKRLGVTVLVTLEETRTVDPARLLTSGVSAVHFPVPDMGAPPIGATQVLCADLEERIGAGAVIAFHCRAGLGRTGTLLASQLVWRGDTAVRAIERVRRVNARCIQSAEQVAFLREFEDAIRPRRVSSLPPSNEVPPERRRRSPNVA